MPHRSVVWFAHTNNHQRLFGYDVWNFIQHASAFVFNSYGLQSHFEKQSQTCKDLLVGREDSSGGTGVVRNDLTGYVICSAVV